MQLIFIAIIGHFLENFTALECMTGTPFVVIMKYPGLVPCWKLCNRVTLPSNSIRLCNHVKDWHCLHGDGPLTRTLIDDASRNHLHAALCTSSRFAIWLFLLCRQTASELVLPICCLSCRKFNGVDVLSPLLTQNTSCFNSPVYLCYIFSHKENWLHFFFSAIMPQHRNKIKKLNYNSYDEW